MGRISTTARQMVGRTLVAGAGACGVAGGGEGLPISRPSPRRALLPLWGLKTMTARAHCKHGPTIVGTRYLRRLRNNSSTPLTRSTNTQHATDTSRSKFDGGGFCG